MLESRNGHHAAMPAAPVEAKSECLPRVLALLAEVLVIGKPLRVQVEHDGLVAEVTVRTASKAAAAAPVEATVEQQGRHRQRYTETEQEIIDVLTEADRPLKATQISLRLGKRELTDYVRKKIYALVKMGEVTAMEDNRYWLASRGAPPIAEG